VDESETDSTKVEKGPLKRVLPFPQASPDREARAAGVSPLDQQKTARWKGRSMRVLVPSKIATLTVLVLVRLVKRL
jgi:hypothetical protein